MATPDWDLLGHIFTFYSLVKALEGNLSTNKTELQELGRFMADGWPHGAKPKFNMARYIGRVFDLYADEGGTEWDKEQWYCSRCIWTFAQRHFRKWWISEKRKRKQRA